MAAETTQVIEMRGGLDKTSSTIELFKRPGAATRLVNFEVARSGGYKRINGFSKYGTATPTGSISRNLGVFKYADGIVACQGTGIYFSTDGDTWIQVNKSNASTGLDVTALGLESAIARSGQGRNFIVNYEGNEEYGKLSLLDGVNKIAQFKITDTGGRKYYYEELGVATAAPQAPQYCTLYKERIVVAGNATNRSTVTWSERFNTSSFSGASAGSVDVGDIITGIKSHRDTLYVFCKDSIHRIKNIDESPSRELVTRRVGCVSGWSIQEVGGDLVFLAPDGIRTIAGTDRIADVEISTISSNINTIISTIVSGISTYDITSTVIRKNSQYRLYYSTAAADSLEQRGIIGTLSYREGGIAWEWSETRGIEVVNITSEMDTDVTEQLFHGDYDGWVYTHNTGASFNGSAVKAIYKTPDIAYGDTGVRKTLYTVKLSMEPSATTSGLSMTLRYDFGDTQIHHPQAYTFSDVYPSATWGTMVWGSSYWGALGQPLLKMNVEGSGSSNSFQFETNDTTSIYTINGIYVDMTPSGRID